MALAGFSYFKTMVRLGGYLGAYACLGASVTVLNISQAQAGFEFTPPPPVVTPPQDAPIAPLPFGAPPLPEAAPIGSPAAVPPLPAEASVPAPPIPEGLPLSVSTLKEEDRANIPPLPVPVSGGVPVAPAPGVVVTPQGSIAPVPGTFSPPLPVLQNASPVFAPPLQAASPIPNPRSNQNGIGAGFVPQPVGQVVPPEPGLGAPPRIAAPAPAPLSPPSVFTPAPVAVNSAGLPPPPAVLPSLNTPPPPLPEAAPLNQGHIQAVPPPPVLASVPISSPSPVAGSVKNVPPPIGEIVNPPLATSRIADPVIRRPRSNATIHPQINALPPVPPPVVAGGVAPSFTAPPAPVAGAAASSVLPPLPPVSVGAPVASGGPVPIAAVVPPPPVINPNSDPLIAPLADPIPLRVQDQTLIRQPRRSARKIVKIDPFPRTDLVSIQGQGLPKPESPINVSQKQPVPEKRVAVEHDPLATSGIVTPVPLPGLPAADGSIAVQTSQGLERIAPVLPPVSADAVFGTVDGFGSDLPLVIALRQIVPAQYAFSFGAGVNPGAKVSWNGGRPWNEVLDQMAKDLGLVVLIQGRIVVIQSGLS